MENLILFGHKNCGKSYWGKRLAKVLQRPFYDTDHLIEKSFALSKKWLSCRQIYTLIGSESFRELEHHAILELQEVQESVISLGGGSLLEKRNLDLLLPLGILLYLKVEKEILKKRTLVQPPAYFKENQEVDFESHFESRERHFATLESIHLHIEDLEVICG